jgi:hypothetical protein
VRVFLGAPFALKDRISHLNGAGVGAAQATQAVEGHRCPGSLNFALKSDKMCGRATGPCSNPPVGVYSLLIGGCGGSQWRACV